MNRTQLALREKEHGMLLAGYAIAKMFYETMYFPTPLLAGALKTATGKLPKKVGIEAIKRALDILKKIDLEDAFEYLTSDLPCEVVGEEEV